MEIRHGPLQFFSENQRIEAWKDLGDNMDDNDVKVGDIVLIQHNTLFNGSGDTHCATEFVRTYGVVCKINSGSRIDGKFDVYMPPHELGGYEWGGLDETYPYANDHSGPYLWVLGGPYDAVMDTYQRMTMEEREFCKSARKKLGLMVQLDRMFWKNDDGG